MAGYRIISADDHIVEPQDLWTTRLDSKFRDQAPRIIREEGSDWWYCEGRKLIGMAITGAQTGKRFDSPESMSFDDVYENVRLGGYIPEEHVKDMDTDGVDVSLLYPTVSLVLFRVEDTGLVNAMFRAYNDLLIEYCAASPKRLKGIAILNVDDVEVGINEMKRCAKLGCIGALIPVYPREGERYDSPRYDPLWASAQDLDMPISLHSATNRAGSGEGYQEGFQSSENDRRAIICNMDHFVRVSLTRMIFAGLFERYPKLQVGAIEHELAWAPHFLERIDYSYTQRAAGATGYRFKNDMIPSDFFHRNVFLGFQEDRLGIRLRDLIGVDSLQWGSDYPHQESTFPRSREILEEVLSDCTEEEKAKIAGGNAARVYRI